MTTQTSNVGGAILLTGGAGFIGSHVAERLLKRGERVVLLDMFSDYYDARLKAENLALLQKLGGSNVKFYKGDVADKSFIEEVWEKERPDRVIHLAASAGVRTSIATPAIYLRSNVEGTLLLLDLAGRNGCSSFVMASSSSVYGGSLAEEFRETDIVDHPVSPYAATKKICEVAADEYHRKYQMPVASLRFFTVYGPRGRPDMAPFIFLDRVSRGVTLQQFGDGTSERDYTYVGDIAQGVVASLDHNRGCQVYNLGNGRPTGLKKFIQMSARFAGRDPIIEQLPNQPGDVPRTCANIDHARELIGYNPTVPLEEGLRRMAKWYRESFLPKFPEGIAGLKIPRPPMPLPPLPEPEERGPVMLLGPDTEATARVQQALKDEDVVVVHSSLKGGHESGDGTYASPNHHFYRLHLTGTMGEDEQNLDVLFSKHRPRAIVQVLPEAGRDENSKSWRNPHLAVREGTALTTAVLRRAARYSCRDVVLVGGRTDGAGPVSICAEGSILMGRVYSHLYDIKLHQLASRGGDEEILLALEKIESIMRVRSSTPSKLSSGDLQSAGPSDVSGSDTSDIEVAST